MQCNPDFAMGKEGDLEPSKTRDASRLTERPGRDRVICPRCNGACMIVNMGGDPDDCPECGGSGFNPEWSTPPEGLSEIETAAWVLTATYYRQEGWAAYKIPEFYPLLLAFGFQTAMDQAMLKEWEAGDYADPNPTRNNPLPPDSEVAP